MMLIPGGRERTEAEYSELFAGAGLQINRIIPTSGYVSIIEAHPAQAPWQGSRHPRASSHQIGYVRERLTSIEKAARME